MRGRPLRHIGRAFAAALIGLATVALPVRAAPVGAVDGGPCIAFDALGYRYIAFGRTGITESGIYLATNRSGAWRVSPHPVTSGKRCAEMLIDDERRIHLLTVVADPDPTVDIETLRYVTNRSGTWRASNVYAGEIGFATLAIDRTGRANVAVRDQEGYFIFERTASGGWARRIVADGIISHISKDPSGDLWLMAIGLGGRPLYRLTDRSGTWDLRRVTQPYSGVRDIAFAIDRSGRRLLYTYDSTTGRIGIFRASGTSWTSVGRPLSQPGRLLLKAAIEPGGAAHLLFVKRGTGATWGIYDMDRHDGVWHTRSIGYGSSFRPDIAVDGRGRVAATYERDGAVWSYWNDWKGPPSYTRISDH